MFPSNARIVVVDDSQFARQNLKNALRELKFSDVLEFEDAASVRAFMSAPDYAQSPAALLITDVNMPNETGMDLVKWVRAQLHLKALPIIVLTASQDKSDILDAGRLGVSSFIIKPFDLATLRDRLNSTWTRAQKSVSK